MVPAFVPCTLSIKAWDAQLRKMMQMGNSSMALLKLFSLISMFHGCLGTSELLTVLPDSTSGIKACDSGGNGKGLSNVEVGWFKTNFIISASCNLVNINLAAVVGEHTLTFPEGKAMSKRWTVGNGYEYEVGNEHFFAHLICGLGVLNSWFILSERRWIRCDSDCTQWRTCSYHQLRWTRKKLCHWKLWEGWGDPVKL